MVDAREHLEKSGILPVGAAILGHSDHNTLGADEWFEKSLVKLRQVEGIVREEVIPFLPDFYGRWHPSGFMVYPLGAHITLGGLRLHVWPKDLRKREEKGLGRLGDGMYDGDIHNHAWNISSIVVAGGYSDIFYDVEPIAEISGLKDEDVSRRGLYHVFRVRYRTSNEPEALTATGNIVTARGGIKRFVNEGGEHTISAGPYHAPAIREAELGATLVFNSARVHPYGPDILVSGSSKPIIGDRLDVTTEEAVEARTQLV